ncbi:SusC/RagA family TonB-linked outer membrane protein [Agriterribacter sp.]|uniref:SusC/RagA family TonB-linked outer membrane protein n=1 Tax=Agriterribacter sp. TaxID=2821509 RepID=UPI002C0B2A8F|nr:SusC/RagA family TonB-linked outer membrane protein [Agriterribacter sp.]HRO46940.1 SusC/RagA family TonB-linked outer membrane protein [Agriterribacter sp.]HRQ19390.1 SusC/RagA family TonB-linked outer membrane protein [Agriterribacter sp.]
MTESNTAGTDWHKEIFNPGITQDYNLSVTGGSENTTYAFSAGYLNEGGIVKHSGFERFTLSGNISSTVKKWLKLGQNIRLSQITDKGLQEEGESGALGVIPQLTAIMPVYDIKGNYAPLSRLTGFDPFINPIGDLERAMDFRRERLAVAGNLHAIVGLPFDLSFKTLFGYTISKSYEKLPLEANPDSYQARADHQLTETSNASRLWNFTNTLSYSKKLSSGHNIEALLGTEAISNYDNGLSATRTKYLVTNKNYWVLNSGEGVQTNSGSASDWSTFSYFGYLHYDFEGRYLVDAIFRRDGSSRFGTGHRYGNFPAFAVGWVVSDENFMASTGKVLDYLKLRASWGRSGNDQIGNYNGFTTFRTDHSFSSYPMDGSNSGLTTGFESLAFGNPDAKWETTSTINFGIDATVLKNLDVAVDIWQRKTSDMLYPRGIPSVNGQATIPSVNIGDMSNKGIDLQLNYRGTALNNDLRYNIGVNFSHYKNKILKLSDAAAETIIGSSYREHIYTRAERGTAFPEFYGYDVVGIFQTQDEVDKHAPFGTYNALGRFKFRDVNEDGVINNDDRTYIGSPHPDFTAGLTAGIQFRQFDLSAIFYASVGNDIANVLRRSLDFNFFQKNRSTRRLYESWGSPYLADNKDAKMPIAEINDATSQLPSTYFIEDGSFLRLQNLQLGYNLPSHWLNRISVNKCRIYVMGSNLLTFTKYTGLDPQIQTSDRTFGIDYGIWPTPKRYLVGLNITL